MVKKGTPLYKMSWFAIPKTGKADAYGYRLCKKWNDGRGCVDPAMFDKSHACDVLIGPNAISGSLEHSRYDHDTEVFGWLPAPSWVSEEEKAFWEWHGSPEPEQRPSRWDPAPAMKVKGEMKEEDDEEDEMEPGQEDEGVQPWSKNFFSTLYYWDRNWNAILFDAAKKAGPGEILKCTAQLRGWTFPIGSKSAQTPDHCFKSHIASMVWNKEEHHPDAQQWSVIEGSPAQLTAPGSASGSAGSTARTGPASGSTKRPRIHG